MGFTRKQVIEHWREQVEPTGKKYGYPQCCINAFVNQPPALLKRMKPSKRDRIRFEAAFLNGEYTGFIPCIRHAILIYRKEIKLPDLIKNRDTSLGKFPNDWTIE